MKSIKIKKRKCKIVAHRGVSGLERENTCAAFVAAAVQPYYGIETDVHVTKDGKFILCHDNDLKRVAGVDFVIEETEFAKLRRVKLYDTTGVKRNDLVLPTMEEYFSICKKYRKIAFLEFKNRIEKEKIAEIIESIKSWGWLTKTVFISFHRDNLIDLRLLQKKVKIQLLTMGYGDDLFDFAIQYNVGLDVHQKIINHDFVKRAHDLGIKVNCYTVNEKETAERFVEYGVDYITTNILV